MKKFLFITLLLLFTSAISFSQEPADTIKVGDGEVEVVIEENEAETEGQEPDESSVVVEFSIGGDRDTTKNLITRWFTLGLGVNPVTVDGNFDLPSGGIYDDFDLRIANSTNVDLGIVQNKLNLINHRLYLKTGLGLDINKYSFDNNFQIDSDSDQWVTIPFSEETKKNRLTATYLHVPLMLNFESSDRHYQSFRVNVGGFAGLRIGSNQKVKFRDSDDNFLDGSGNRYKQKDNFNFNTLNYGLRTELGYGPINIYGKYHLNDLFEDEQQLNNLSIGLMLVPF